jgi:hypothetical protein
MWNFLGESAASTRSAKVTTTDPSSAIEKVSSTYTLRYVTGVLQGCKECHRGVTEVLQG